MIQNLKNLNWTFSESLVAIPSVIMEQNSNLSCLTSITTPIFDSNNLSCLSYLASLTTLISSFTTVFNSSMEILVPLIFYSTAIVEMLPLIHYSSRTRKNNLKSW